MPAAAEGELTHYLQCLMHMERIRFLIQNKKNTASPSTLAAKQQWSGSPFKGMETILDTSVQVFLTLDI